MTLPPPIKTYFDAEARNDADALMPAFAADAQVRDEGATHTGPDAIRDWWTAAKAKYQHQAEPLEASQDGDTVTVRARVSGQFPNSPATLTFAFTLSGDRIACLEIG